MRLNNEQIRNFLFILIALYYSQGALFTQGTIVTQIALLLILGISSLYLLKVYTLPRRAPIVNAWSALLLLNVLGYLLTGDLKQHINYLKAILVVLLPFYSFYYFAVKNMLKRKHFILFFIVMLAISILQFYYTRKIVLESRLHTGVDMVNNSAYLFVGLIPFVFLFKNRILSILSMGILLFYIVLGAKRGALIVGGIGTLLFAYYQIRTVPQRMKSRVYPIVTLGLGTLIWFVYRMYAQNDFVMKRMGGMFEGQSSGRDVIYSNILNAWYNSDNLLNYIFGFGFYASTKLSGTGHAAHNDWLELLANFGLLGVSVYLFLFYCGFKSALTPGWSKDKKLLMFSMMTIWFVTTLFSMGFNSASFTGMFLLIAYLTGSKHKDII